MEFRLNNIISDHLKEYNVQANPVRRLNQQGQSQRNWLVAIPGVALTKKTLGVPSGMIPSSVISDDLQLSAIADINNSPCEHRIRAWFDENNKVIAYISHYESMWHSFWFAPDGADYIYGATAVCKDTSSVRKKIFDEHRTRIFGKDRHYGNPEIPVVPARHGFAAEDMERFKVGRCYYLRKTVLVTKVDIAAGFTFPVWQQPHSCDRYRQKGYQQRQIVDKIVKQLQANPPFLTWTDETWSQAITRTQGNNNTIWYCLSDVSRNCWPTYDRFLPSNVVSYEQFSHTIDWWSKYWEFISSTPDYRVLGPEFIYKPAVHALLKQAVDDTQYIFELAQLPDDAHWDKQRIAAPMLNFDLWMWWCTAIRSIWPDCPQDLLVNNYDLLIRQKPKIMRFCDDVSLIGWLRTHMPVKSFFSILEKNVEALDIEHPYERVDQRGRYHSYPVSLDELRNFIRYYDCSDLADTFNAIRDILRSGKELEKPSRWRLTTFHDHVISELWKIRNTDFDLPQDMFPKPKHVVVGDTRFTIIQPMSAHQLAQWGQAARNCVGGSGYSNDIRAKKHFILMVMLDNKPRYTVQLRLKNNVLEVAQMKDIANRNLDSDEKAALQQALNEALTSRTQELVPVGSES